MIELKTFDHRLCQLIEKQEKERQRFMDSFQDEGFQILDTPKEWIENSEGASSSSNGLFEAVALLLEMKSETVKSVLVQHLENATSKRLAVTGVDPHGKTQMLLKALISQLGLIDNGNDVNNHHLELQLLAQILRCTINVHIAEHKGTMKCTFLLKVLL